MDNWTHNFKNTLTSSYHDNFRLDIFYSKTFLYSFFGIGKRIKSWQNLQTLFAFEYLFTLSYFYMFIYIAYEHIHLAPGSLAAQLSNLPTSSTGAATFCQLPVSFPIHVMNVSSITGSARELKPLDAPFCLLMILGFCG